MLRLRLLTTHIGDLKMRNPTTTTYNMLQASLEMLKKLAMNTPNFSHADKIDGVYDNFTLEQIENHLIVQGGMKKTHVIRVEVEVYAMSKREAIIEA